MQESSRSMSVLQTRKFEGANLLADSHPDFGELLCSSIGCKTHKGPEDEWKHCSHSFHICESSFAHPEPEYLWRLQRSHHRSLPATRGRTRTLGNSCELGITRVYRNGNDPRTSRHKSRDHFRFQFCNPLAPCWRKTGPEDCCRISIE